MPLKKRRDEKKNVGLTNHPLGKTTVKRKRQRLGGTGSKRKNQGKTKKRKVNLTP